MVYSETHTLLTNDYGLMTTTIGEGNPQTGIFTDIEWGASTFSLRIEVDADGGTNYQLLGESQMASVPYALHAVTATNVDDADADTTNELIDSVVLSNMELSIFEAGISHGVNLVDVLSDALSGLDTIAFDSLSIVEEGNVGSWIYSLTIHDNYAFATTVDDSLVVLDITTPMAISTVGQVYICLLYTSPSPRD